MLDKVLPTQAFPNSLIPLTGLDHTDIKQLSAVQDLNNTLLLSIWAHSMNLAKCTDSVEIHAGVFQEHESESRYIEQQ